MSVHGSEAARSSEGPQKPATLLEAFAHTAKALQLFGLERIRVIGLSAGCTAEMANTMQDEGKVRVVTEQEFMRSFVFLSRPCIILDALDAWPAMHKWRDDRYLFDLDHHLPEEEQEQEEQEEDDDKDEEEQRGAAEDEEETKPAGKGPKKVTVALTPNGRADAVTYVLYDAEDLPKEEEEQHEKKKEEQPTGAATDDFAHDELTVQPVMLRSHPLLRAEDANTASLRMEKIFMYAAEVKVTLPTLYDLLVHSPTVPPPQPMYIDMRRYKNEHETPVVAYAQLQNNCLNTEYTHLHQDLRDNVCAFGSRVFGEPPEAANVWLGVPASVSSMHQDWVENLYPVIRGIKEFILIPPWEGVFVPKPEIPAAGFALRPVSKDKSCDDAASSSLSSSGPRYAFQPYPQKDGSAVPWMDFDFTPDLLEHGGEAAVLAALHEAIDECASHKSKDNDEKMKKSVVETKAERQLKELHPLVAYVHPGETLYLPSMWLHRVAQHADEHDIRARARHLVQRNKEGSAATAPPPPLPLIAAVNYWYNMSFVNPAVVLLREFGLLL